VWRMNKGRVQGGAVFEVSAQRRAKGETNAVRFRFLPAMRSTPRTQAQRLDVGARSTTCGSSTTGRRSDLVIDCGGIKIAVGCYSQQVLCYARPIRSTSKRTPPHIVYAAGKSLSKWEGGWVQDTCHWALGAAMMGTSSKTPHEGRTCAAQLIWQCCGPMSTPAQEEARDGRCEKNSVLRGVMQDAGQSRVFEGEEHWDVDEGLTGAN